MGAHSSTVPYRSSPGERRTWRPAVGRALGWTTARQDRHKQAVP